MSDSRNKHGLRLFSITEDQIKKLIRPDPEAADLIGAFCVIALHTDRSGRYSTAGSKAVRTALHLGSERATRLLDRLRGRGLIQPAAGLLGKLKKEMPIREGRATVRWVILPDESRKIWFPSELVRGVGRWRSPLATLAQAGSDSARLLLASYLLEDQVQFGGIDPTRGIYKEYFTEILREGPPLGRKLLLECCEKTNSSSGDFITKLLDFSSDENGQTPDFWNAFERLCDRGFLSERLTIFTGKKESPEMRLLYPLHFFDRYGHPPKGEEPISGKMHSLSSAIGYSLADTGGRFTMRRFAFLADDENVQAVGIYVHRFRNTYPKFEEVAAGWAMMQESKKTWAETADFLLERIKTGKG